jgi:hypothetical protein
VAVGPVPVNRLAVACGGLGLLVVLASAVEGTRSRRAGLPAPVPLPAPTPGVPTPTARPRWLPPVPHQAGGLPPAVEAALLGVLAAGVLLLLVLVVRRLWRRRWRWARPAVSSALVGDGVAGAPVTHPDAPVVRRGIARALDLLAEDREPGDAVVQAWLGLEQAAEDSGVPRARAETPTEFTARLLGRVPADRAAVRTLLDLYSRARFAARGGSPADAGRARAALEVLARSWRDGGPREP